MGVPASVTDDVTASLDLTRLLDTAEAAALAGGAVVRGGLASANVEVKGAGDYVTEVDRASERAIVEVLSAGAPGISVVGEEGGGDLGGRAWVVDPLDGTTNFLHGFPAVAVSIALVEDGRPVVGVVHAPFLSQTWTAVRGGGAWLGRDRLAVSERDPDRAVLGTGFPFRRKELLPRYLEVLRGALERFEDLRRPGAAALDLAWVAGGVFDGFFELGLAAWDVAAGGLLIEEAGGVVTDWTGGNGWLGGDILAGSASVHAGLLSLTVG